MRPDPDCACRFCCAPLLGVCDLPCFGPDPCGVTGCGTCAVLGPADIDCRAWENGETGGYTPEAIAILEAAEAAIVDATERWFQLTCAPFGVCCRSFRRCVPCGCSPYRRCECCRAFTAIDDLPLCGPVIDAALRIYPADGAAPNVHDIENGGLWVDERTDGTARIVLTGGLTLPAQDPSAPPGSPGTWELTVRSGLGREPVCTTDGRCYPPVPRYVIDAIAEQACAILDRCAPSDVCATVPAGADRVTSTNDGVTIEWSDPDDDARLDAVDTPLSAGERGLDQWNDALALWACPTVEDCPIETFHDPGAADARLEPWSVRHPNPCPECPPMVMVP